MSKVITTNSKAFHDYFVEDTIEAGIMLKGSEVKSIRAGRVNLKDSYVFIKKGEPYLCNAHVSPYEKGSVFNPEPRRDRKLLLHKEEIRKLRAKVEQKGYTLVPIKVYFEKALCKIEVGVCRGKQLHDKRASIAERENKRELDRIIKEKNHTYREI